MMHACRRMPAWWVASIVAVGLVGWVAPQQLEVLVYKLALVTIAVKVGYWADRLLYRNAPRIDATLPRDVYGGLRLLSRAVIAYAILNALSVGI